MNTTQHNNGRLVFTILFGLGITLALLDCRNGANNNDSANNDSINGKIIITEINGRGDQINDYIEIYNTTSTAISLANFYVTDELPENEAGKTVTLGETQMIGANEYLLICTQTNGGTNYQFNPAATCLTTTGSFGIGSEEVNGIRLRNAAKELIDEVVAPIQAMNSLEIGNAALVLSINHLTAADNDVTDNWGAATTDSHATGSDKGTPGLVNTFVKGTPTFSHICTGGTPSTEKTTMRNIENCSRCNAGFTLNTMDSTCRSNPSPPPSLVGKVIITEINGRGDQINDYIEIYNTTSEAISLANFYVTDELPENEAGKTVTLSATQMIGANEYLVICTKANDGTDYQFSPTATCLTTTGSFGIGREESDGIHLKDASGQVIDSVLTPIMTDDSLDLNDASLELSINHLTAAENDVTENWGAATTSSHATGSDKGTPGRVNTFTP